MPSPAHALQALCLCTARTHDRPRLPAACAGELAPLLRAANTLLLSRNGAVVLSAATLLLKLAPRDSIGAVVRPLCRLARAPRAEVAFAALQVVLALTARRAELFAQSVSAFFTSAADPPYLADARIRVLASLTAPATVGAISGELLAYLRSP